MIDHFFRDLFAYTCSAVGLVFWCVIVWHALKTMVGGGRRRK